MRSHLSLGEVKPEDIPDCTLMAVADTLRKSSTFLKLSDDGKKVCRTTEFGKTEEVIEQVNERTIATSPFDHNVKMRDVKSYFAQFGKVQRIQCMRVPNIFYYSEARGWIPLEGAFKDEAKAYMGQIIKTITESGAPLLEKFIYM